MPNRIMNHPYYARLAAFLDASNNESPRGRALVAASLIDEMLGEILTAYLLDGGTTKKLLSGPTAPVSTLYSKALLCRSLCLVSEVEFKEIEIIRKIRNEFAHNLDCSFDSDKVSSHVERLQFGLPDDFDKGSVGNTGTFSMVCTSVVTALYNRSHFVRKDKVEEKHFPR